MIPHRWHAQKRPRFAPPPPSGKDYVFRPLWTSGTSNLAGLNKTVPPPDRGTALWVLPEVRMNESSLRLGVRLR